jgi:small subunit ribosomal protein S21|tara:strand:- start:3 stop:215 length:213 start_codon:yes stop_codon:yes gene_type:complete
MTLEVKVRNNNVEKAIRQLKKKVMKDGLLKELKQRQFYEKPSLKKQRLRKESIKRVNKLRRQQERLDNSN